KRDAEKAWEAFKREIRDSGCTGRPQTFAQVAALYVVATNASHDQRRWVDRICDATIPAGKGHVSFGSLRIRDVLPMHVSTVAHVIYPSGKNSSRNKVIGTAAAV